MTAKYSNIQAHHIFQPVAVESLGPINASGRVFTARCYASAVLAMGLCLSVGVCLSQVGVLL